MKKIFKYIIIVIITITLLICSISFIKYKTQKKKTYNPSYFIYHDDVAWVQLYENGSLGGKNYLGVVCIDKEGQELFSMPDVNRENVSNFFNNMALVNERYIINKQGEIIHDLKQEMDAQIHIFQSNYFDGFIFVHKEIDNIWRTGILNDKLEWVLEPTIRFNDIKEKGNFLYYSDTIGYYDVLTNEFINEDEFQTRKFQRSFPDSDLIFLFYNNNNMFTYYDAYVDLENVTDNSNYIFFSGSGTKYIRDYFEDESYLDIARGSIFIENADKPGYYNKDYELVLDLSMYRGLVPLSNIVNGKCLVKFETERNEILVGLMNISGDFLFVQPKYQYFNSEKIVFNDCYFDWDGNYYKKEDEE